MTILKPKLEAKSPDDVPAYKALVLDVAESVAAAAKGVSAAENTALDKIRTKILKNVVGHCQSESFGRARRVMG